MEALPPGVAAGPETLQWGHGREAMDGWRAARRRSDRRRCFNGAMAVRPWMAPRIGAYPTA